MRDFGTGSTVMGIVENVLKVALVAVTWKVCCEENVQWLWSCTSMGCAFEEDCGVCRGQCRGKCSESTYSRACISGKVLMMGSV